MDNVQKFKEIARNISELYKKKNAVYGNSFGDTYKKLGIISAVTRISDKYNRLCNLATNPDIDNLGESLEDTLKDLASYAIMTLIELAVNTGSKELKWNICIFPDAQSWRTSAADNNDIKVGDKFYCKESVVMEDGEYAYKCGEYYVSDRDGCITDESGDIDHEWNDILLRDYSWTDYFEKV